MENDTKILSWEVDDSIDVTGTTYRGELTASYLELCEVFGEPTYTNADPYEKVHAEWSGEAEVPDFWDEGETIREVFTIYDWKTTGVPTDKYEWHIGGNSYDSVAIATKIFNDKLS